VEHLPSSLNVAQTSHPAFGLTSWNTISISTSILADQRDQNGGDLFALTRKWACDKSQGYVGVSTNTDPFFVSLPDTVVGAFIL
jgi:hypothetical protein